jgi:predicted permease
MSNLFADITLAFRLWRRAPLLTIVAIASIALGMGATTAVYTLVDQVLLRTLPVDDPRALVQVTSQGSKYGSNWGDGSEQSFPMYLDLRDHNQVFDGMFGRFGFAFQIGYGGRTERVAGELVTGTYFPVLRVGPALGRVLTPDDDLKPNGHPVAVLSHAFWTSRFASDPGVVGQSMVVNGHPFQIVGVAREGFDGVEVGQPKQVFVPIMMKAQITPGWNGLDDPRFHWVRLFGRLKPGISPEQARAALQPQYRARLEREVKERAFATASPETRQRFVESQLVVEPSSGGRSGLRRTLTRPLLVLLAIASGVLLIACANVANLLLARGAARQREMAIRLALGSARRRLIGQLLVESVLLAMAGTLAGLALSVVGAPLLLSFFVNPDQPQPISTWPDLRVLGVTIAVSLVTGIAFGLAPAMQSTRPSLAPTLKEGAGSVLGGNQGRLRKVLVASQVAVSLLLLIGAGLFLRTLDNLLAVDVGIKTSQLIAFAVDPSLNGYTTARTKQLAQDVLARLRTLPGVSAAGFSTQRILEGNRWSSSYAIEGYTPKGDESVNLLNHAISPGYFEAMGMRLLSGRDFTDRDARTVPPPDLPDGREATDFRVAIVNEKFVRQYFPTSNPIGRHIGFGGDPGTPTPIEIVGVVSDAKYTDVRDEIQGQVFFPYLEGRNPGGFTVYVQTSREPEAMFGAIRQEVQRLDPNLPIYATRTLERQVAQSLRNERLVATMSSAFGVLATLLAVVGLYGVMAYSVGRRTREIGIRMALGARSHDISWLVTREVLLIVAVGIAAGLPAAWWLGRYIAAQLYGVKPTDPFAIGAAIAGLTIVALLAGLIPSRRAANVQPTVALRYE